MASLQQQQEEADTAHYYHGGSNNPEQVTDQYLTCKLCTAPAYRDPRILQCGHSFCHTCLQAYTRDHGGQVFPCHTCQLVVCLPRGGTRPAPANLFLQTQVDRLMRRHNNAGTGVSPGPTFYNIKNY